jgi:hypothetical protein
LNQIKLRQTIYTIHSDSTLFTGVLAGVDMQCGPKSIIVKRSHVYNASVKGVDLYSGCANWDVKAVVDAYGLLDKNHFCVGALSLVDLSKLFKDIM